MSTPAPGHLMIVRLGAAGDVVHGLPVAATLRNAFPQARLSWLVEQRLVQLLDGNPTLNDVVSIDLKGARKRGTRAVLGELRRIRSDLRARGIDVVIDVQGLTKSAFLGWLSKAPMRIGFDWGSIKEKPAALFATHRIRPEPRAAHVVELNLELLRPLPGIQPVFEFPLPSRGGANVREFTSRLPQPRVVLNPAAGWLTKRWAVERYAEVARRLSDRATVIALWGTPEEEASAQRLAELGGAVVAPATDWIDLCDLLRECELIVSGDTGPLHVAAALGLACVGLMGPTDPIRNGPFGPGHAVVRVARPCAGCYKRSCPESDCMAAISVDRVIEALRTLRPDIVGPDVETLASS